MMRWLLITLLAAYLSGCATGRYQQRNDSFPSQPPASLDLSDASPRYEPVQLNKAYEVFGRRYTPLKSASGYIKNGRASWYGQKFHGHLTANGEIYDMYAMSAAHKTLPLPSYVQVTNLENGRSVIVRVNDRGPFHGDRIIDLSYAAAVKLDMLKTGTAEVRLQSITVLPDGKQLLAGAPALTAPKAPQNSPQQSGLDDSSTSLVPAARWYIQVLASKDEPRLMRLGAGLSNLYLVPSHTHGKQGVYRLRLGPFVKRSDADTLLTELKQNGYEQAFALAVDGVSGTQTTTNNGTTGPQQGTN